MSSLSDLPVVGPVVRAVGPLRGEGRGWTLLTIAVGWFLLLGLRFVVPALLPVIRTDFTISDTSAGAAITLLWVTYALMQFPAGALVDRVGERRLLVTSAVLSSGALVAYFLAPTFLVFLLATALFGFGSGMYGPPRGTTLSRTFPDRDGTAFGAVLAAGSVGAALLPAVAIVLAGVAGWRLALGVMAPAFLVVAVALWVVVPDRSLVADGGDHSGEGARASTVEETPDGLSATVGAVRRAVGSRSILLAVAGAGLMLFVFQGLTAFFTSYLVTEKSIAPGTAGVLFGLLFLSGAVSQSAGGGLADRVGYGPVLAGSALVGTVPLVALPFVSGIVALAAVSAALGVRLTIGPLSNAYIVSLLPPDVRGTAWGLLRTGFFLFGAFGSTAVGAMADRDLYAEAFLVLAALSVVAGLIYLVLPARDGPVPE